MKSKLDQLIELLLELNIPHKIEGELSDYNGDKITSITLHDNTYEKAGCVIDFVNGKYDSTTIWEWDSEDVSEIETPGLEKYPEEGEPNWISVPEIHVKTQRDKEQLLLAFEHIHDSDINTDYLAVNLIAHMYQHPNSIVVNDN